MTEQFDVVVIGAGPGGYVAAIRAAQLGMKVACIDAWQTSTGKPAPGGTCTNVGCIPSKALLQSSEYYELAAHELSEHGIRQQKLTMDVAQMLARKDKVVQQNNDGILFLFRKNKVTFFHGLGSLTQSLDDTWEIEINPVSSDTEKGVPKTVSAKQVVIATGSTPKPYPSLPFDQRQILDNAGALSIAAVPKRLGIIGAGVIGLEVGSVWRRLGAEVTILEAAPAFLATVDEQIAKEAWKSFSKQGLAIQLGVQIEEVKPTAKAVAVVYRDVDQKQQRVSFDQLIVAIGRIPNTHGLGAEGIGLQKDERGFIVVDEQCRTNLPRIWAVGDVVRGPMLAHKAEEEGVAVAERIAGQQPHLDFNTIPWVIYTSPEIAWVGQTEQQLRAAKIPYRAGTFPFMANGRARALGATQGLVKFLAHKETDRILGVHILGAMASELISEAVVAMEFGASSEDIARICHAHPSLSEALKEAALAVDGRSLNF